MSSVQLAQLLRDVPRPNLDLCPVTEVAFGHHRASGRELSQRLLREGEPAGIEGTEEDVVVSRVDRLPEPGDLLRLGGRAQVHSFGVGGAGAKRAAAEQPHPPIRQQVPVAHDEGRRVLQPVRRVSGTADDEPLVAAQIARLLNRSSLSMLSGKRENLRDAFGDLPGGTVFAGKPNENQHLHRLLYQRGSNGQGHNRVEGPPATVPARMRVRATARSC